MEIGLAVRLKAYLGLESLCEREINQKLRTKINQKFIGVRRTAHFLFWSALRAEIFQNQIKIFQKSWAVRLKAYLGLECASHRNLSKILGAVRLKAY